MILTINKSGEIIQKNIKTYDNLYSICNYRNNNNFELLHVWDNEIHLYGKTSGRAGYENNYEFPYPLEKEQFYGTLCIIKKKNEAYVPITLSEWTQFYNKKMGITETPETNEVHTEIMPIMSDKELTYEEYETEDESSNI